MKQMHESCLYACGPYKSYCGRADYDEDAEIFHGQVIGTRDVITFQGKNLKELRTAFTESVDDYLSFCKKAGEPPEKPFSGKFVARLDPDLHRRLSIMAQLAGKSLNQFISDCLQAATQCGPLPPAFAEPMPPPRESVSKSGGREKRKRVSKRVGSLA